MTAPISSGSSQWYHPTDDDLNDPSNQPKPSGFCGHPEGVIEGLVCRDQTAISDACRRSKPGDIDNYLCDDKNLKKAQDTMLDVAKKAFWKAVELVVGSKVSK